MSMHGKVRPFDIIIKPHNFGLSLLDNDGHSISHECCLYKTTNLQLLWKHTTLFVPEFVSSFWTTWLEESTLYRPDLTQNELVEYICKNSSASVWVPTLRKRPANNLVRIFSSIMHWSAFTIRDIKNEN